MIIKFKELYEATVKPKTRAVVKFVGRTSEPGRNEGGIIVDVNGKKIKAIVWPSRVINPKNALLYRCDEISIQVEGTQYGKSSRIYGISEDMTKAKLWIYRDARSSSPFWKRSNCAS